MTAPVAVEPSVPLTHARKLGSYNASEMWALVKRIMSSAGEHDVTLAAAGLAFFAVLGLFPSLLALISIYGIVADPADVQSVTQIIVRTLPHQAEKVVTAGIHDFVGRSAGHLSISAVVGFLTLLWSASSGMEALVSAINVAYAIPKRRGFFARTGIATIMTLVAMFVVMVFVPVMTFLPKIFIWLHMEWGMALLRWPLVATLSFFGLAVLYRQAPDRKKRPKFAAVRVGAATATMLWMAATAVYSLYFGLFANLVSTYGALEGVIVLLAWMYMSSIIVLLGAEVNAALEATTVHEPGVRPRRTVAQSSGQPANDPA